MQESRQEMTAASTWAVAAELESGGHKTAGLLQGSVPHTDARVASADWLPTVLNSTPIPQTEPLLKPK